MHRVYNSAFMHMLRDEDNEGYRSVIRETVAFDPRILGRYVNFMNNPDERTAIDQFGSGDKYVGVATLLATLPGLPMFGHGQVEGFGEKYGMEFRRAMLDEVPDASLIARHEREVFPLLRERWRFAAADEFRMLDALRTDGSVDEDVYAFTNQVGGSYSLVVYRNRFAEGQRPHHGVPAPTLGIPDDAAAWLVLRDVRNGLEHLRNCHDIHARGLELDLHAYQSHVFLDPAVVWDDPAGDWGRLAWRIGLSGVPDVQAALRDQLLEPTRLAVDSLFLARVVRDVAGAALANRPERGHAHRLGVGRACPTARGISRAIGATSGRGASVDNVRSALALRLVSLASVVRAGRAATASRAGVTAGTPVTATAAATAPRTRRGPPRSRASRTAPGTDDAIALRRGWAPSGRAGRRWWAGRSGRAWATSWAPRHRRRRGGVRCLGRWAGDRPHARRVGVPVDAASRVPVVVRALLAVPLGALSTGEPLVALSTWLQTPAVRAATGWNQWLSAEYVGKEDLEGWLEALAARDAAAGLTDAFDRAEALAATVAAHGFRVDLPGPASDATTPSSD